MYYVYQHIREDLNEIFYIGLGTLKKGKGTFKHKHYRAYETTNRSKYWYNIVNKTKYKIEIIFETTDKEEAQNKEIELINLYGRKITGEGSLCNIEIGGKGYEKRPKNIINYPVNQIDKESNKVIHVWKNLVEINEKFGFLKTNISKCCRKKAITAYGYKWSYVNIRDFDNIIASTSRKKPSERRKFKNTVAGSGCS